MPGWIHFTRADEIILRDSSGEYPPGLLGDAAQYLGRDAFFNLKK